VDEILETSPELFRVREAAGNIFSLSQTLLDEASHLANGFENLAGGRTLDTVGGYVLGLLALASIILIGLVMVRETNRQLRETAEKNERNQQAIMRLLDEIEELADGDLTVTVGDRRLHRRHRRLDQLFRRPAARPGRHHQPQRRQVAAAVQDTQNTAASWPRPPSTRPQQISEASEAVGDMVESIDRVSAHAYESAKVAERSVAIANKGNEVVHNTITAWTTSASRSRTPPSGSSASASLPRKSATSSA
jgi:twitching motility protein PilJ